MLPQWNFDSKIVENIYMRLSERYYRADIIVKMRENKEKKYIVKKHITFAWYNNVSTSI